MKDGNSPFKPNWPVRRLGRVKIWKKYSVGICIEDLFSSRREVGCRELIWEVWQQIFDLQIKDKSHCSQYRSHKGIEEKVAAEWKEDFAFSAEAKIILLYFFNSQGTKIVLRILRHHYQKTISNLTSWLGFKDIHYIEIIDSKRQKSEIFWWPMVTDHILTVTFLTSEQFCIILYDPYIYIKSFPDTW